MGSICVESGKLCFCMSQKCASYQETDKLECLFILLQVFWFLPAGGRSDAKTNVLSLLSTSTTDYFPFMQTNCPASAEPSHWFLWHTVSSLASAQRHLLLLFTFMRLELEASCICRPR